MKKLKIGLLSNLPAAAPKIKRADVAGIVRRLTAMEKKILQAVFIDYVGLKKMPSMRPVDQLCAKGIVRKDVDLISRKDIYVLNRGGQMVCDALKGKPKPKKKPPTATVKVGRHVFEKKTIAGIVQIDCGICDKLPDHPVHIAEGRYLCPGLTPLSEAGADAVRCLNEVDRQGNLCIQCNLKAEAWRKAEVIRMSPACPNCGGVKAVAPSTACSFDRKCYHALPRELQIGLFKQGGEVESAFRVRYPAALKAAQDYLKKNPVSQEAINAAAKLTTEKRKAFFAGQGRA